MLNVAKENLCINKIVAHKKEIIIVEGDMIVPDAKPDILNTISTSGVVGIYKKELQEEKIRVDGSINTYIMYLPDQSEEGVRGLNTTLDFSEVINIPNCNSEMQAKVTTSVKSIECKVINGRKLGIKATLEIDITVLQKEEIEIVNDITESSDIQILKDIVNVNSLVGTGETKLFAKDTIQIDNIDLLAEILKLNVNITDRDIKISYNKILTKSEVEVKIMYLTEDNRINQITYKIPTVGFIDIQDISEENICDVNYEIKNIIVKPNNQEEHSIYVEIEMDVTCDTYEEKQINLIKDMYSPSQNLNVQKQQILTMCDKQTRNETKNINEVVNLGEIRGLSLIDVDTVVEFSKENKINSKILYEGEAKLRFIFTNSATQVIIKEASIPFDYVINDLINGEEINTNNEIEIKSQDFIIKNDEEINANINLGIRTDMYRNSSMELISEISEEGEREEQDYSLIIYIVKKGDTLWNIAKKFGSTVDDIARANGIEDENLIMPGEKLYIPKYINVRVESNV